MGAPLNFDDFDNFGPHMQRDIEKMRTLHANFACAMYGTVLVVGLIALISSLWS